MIVLNKNAIHFRLPSKEDGADVWRLVKDTLTLDVNSVYAYIMLCDYFKDTCVLAEDDGGIAGFVSAFRSPLQQDCLFIWQIAVSPSKQRRGIGKMLLQELLVRESCRNIRYLETTISPSNLASRGLFLWLAKHYTLECYSSGAHGYAASLFSANQSHEDEILYRLGPLPQKETR